jgi:hypothetical protein
MLMCGSSLLAQACAAALGSRVGADVSLTISCQMAQRLAVTAIDNPLAMAVPVVRLRGCVAVAGCGSASTAEPAADGGRRPRRLPRVTALVPTRYPQSGSLRGRATTVVERPGSIGGIG